MLFLDCLDFCACSSSLSRSTYCLSKDADSGEDVLNTRTCKGRVYSPLCFLREVFQEMGASLVESGSPFLLVEKMPLVAVLCH